MLKRNLSCIILLLFLFSGRAVAAKTIEADKLEYDGDKRIYYLYGNVILTQDNTTLTADFGRYDENTSFAYFSGAVFYEDPEVKMEADEAVILTDNKTGTLRRANMVFKKDGYYVKGETIVKRGENSYYAEKSSFTSCDTPVPAWCFYADTADILTEDRLLAKGVFFKVNDTSVLYTPVYQAGLKRKSGFLMPSYGYKKGKGTYLDLPFYYVISENRDLTVNINTYTRRGTGEGLEYRYIEHGGITGSWYIYHLSDRVDDKEYLQIKGEHKQFLHDFYTNFNVNYLNSEDYFKKYSPNIQLNVSRYLQSSGDIGYATPKTRTYLLSQFQVDLQYYTKNVSQKIPELGFTVHPTEFFQSSLFSMNSSIANFISEQSVKGQRFDLYPKIHHSFGDMARFTQAAGVRSTFYDISLNRQAGSYNSMENIALTYGASLDTTLVKNYGSLTHVMQPAVSYNYISSGLDTTDKFTLDSTEYFKKTSTAEISLMNYLRDKNGTFLYGRVSEGYDTSKETNKLEPVKFQFGLVRPLVIKAESLYDFNDSRLKAINSEMIFRIIKTDFAIGERYNKDNDIMYMTSGLGFNITKELRLNTAAWYDAKTDRLGYLGISLLYMKQCWGLGLLYSQTTDQYGIYLSIELKGVGKYELLGSGQSTAL